MTHQEGSGEIIKNGWCTKLGGFFKTWKRRWFVLQGNTLSYYTDKDQALKGTILITPDCQIDKYPQCKKQPAFCIQTAKRLYQLVPTTEQEVDEWIKVLNEVKNGKNSINDQNNNAVNNNETNNNDNRNTDNKDTKPAEKVTLDDFEIIKTLGRGSYGKVTLAKNKHDNQIYALKSISKEVLQQYSLIDSTIRERDTLMKIHHPFLVSAHYAFQSNTHIFLAQEFVPGGELFNYLINVQTVSEDVARNYTAMLLLAIGELHKHGIIHRDLKPDNILLDEKGYIKITDFGLVKYDIKEGNTASSFCGTPEYMAPEIIQEEAYGRPVDWWALGILTYQMLIGCPTFYDNNRNAMFESILNDDPEYPEEVSFSNDAIDFINKLLIKDPKTRLGSSEKDYVELQEHPWYKDFNWEMLLEKKIQMEYIPKVSSSNDASNYTDFSNVTPTVTPHDPDLISSETQNMLQGFTYVNNEAMLDN